MYMIELDNLNYHLSQLTYLNKLIFFSSCALSFLAVYFIAVGKFHPTLRQTTHSQFMASDLIPCK